MSTAGDLNYPSCYEKSRVNILLRDRTGMICVYEKMMHVKGSGETVLLVSSIEDDKGNPSISVEGFLSTIPWHSILYIAPAPEKEQGK